MTVGVVLGIIAVAMVVASWRLATPVDETHFTRKVREGVSVRHLLFLDRSATHIKSASFLILLTEIAAFGTLLLSGEMSEATYVTWKFFSLASGAVLLLAFVQREDLKAFAQKS